MTQDTEWTVNSARNLPLAETLDIKAMGAEGAGILKTVGLKQDEYSTLLDMAQAHFKKTGRESRLFTLPELYVFGAMLSEHCSYKSSKPVLKTLPTEGPQVMVGVGQDAGVTFMGWSETGKKIGLVQKCESHNHPSYEKVKRVVDDQGNETIQLFGDGMQGATTGIGGDVRDVKCMGASVVAVYDALRFGEPRTPEEAQWIINNILTVREGIANYGNPLGIAHGHGCIEMWHRMAGNVLGNVNAIGYIEKDRIISSAIPDVLPLGKTIDDYVAIYVGKATDATGFGGVAFASKELDGADAESNQAAVQDGDPFLKKVEFEALDEVFDYFHMLGLTEDIAFQDMGGAGLLCSTSEPPSKAGRDYGIIVDGDTIPVNLPKRRAEVLLNSETQERWMFVIPREHQDAVLEIVNRHHELGNISNHAAAVPVGRPNASGDYIFTLDGKREVDLPVELITKGIVYQRESKPKDLEFPEPVLDLEESPERMKEVFLTMMRSPNISSDLCIHQRYDKQVGNRTIIERGQAPACVMTVDGLEEIGAVTTFGGNTHLGLLDPKAQAAYAVLNSAWRMACVGGSLISIGNNANYGNPEDPEQFWEFEQGQAGVKEACENIFLAGDYLDELERYAGWDDSDDDIDIDEGFAEEAPKEQDTPHVVVVSGNVSFYNVCDENPEQTKKGDSIPPSTIVAGNGWIEDWNKSIDSRLKGDPESDPTLLYLVGERRRNELGASMLYYELGESLGRNVPSLDYEQDNNSMDGLRSSISKGYVLAADVIEKGGLAATIGRMCAESGLGATIYLHKTGGRGASSLAKMYSEKCGAVVQVPKSKHLEFEKEMEASGGSCHILGPVNHHFLEFQDGDWSLFEVKLSELQQAYRRDGLCALLGEVTE